MRGVCAVLAALVPPRGKENKRGWKFLGSALPLALRWLAGDPAAPEPVIEDAAWLVREAGERNAGERTWRSLALAMLGNLS